MSDFPHSSFQPCHSICRWVLCCNVASVVARSLQPDQQGEIRPLSIASPQHTGAMPNWDDSMKLGRIRRRCWGAYSKATQSDWTAKLSPPTCSAIASDALAAVGDVTMVNEAKLVYIMIVVDVRLHFVVSNFESGHSSIVMSMIYVIFSAFEISAATGYKKSSFVVIGVVSCT